MKETIITGLDIGSAKISSVIASIDKDLKITVLGIGKAKTAGFLNGKVQDLKLFSESIISSITTAESVANKTAQNLYVSIAGSYLSSHISQGTVHLTSGQGLTEIEQLHVDHVLSNAVIENKRHFNSEQYEIIHCIPQYYTLDEQENIPNPIGMDGYELSVKALIVTAEVAPMRNIKKAIKMAGFSEAKYVYAPIASAKATMNEYEQDLGGLLLDVGSNISDLLLMNKKYPQFALSVDKGSQLITYDLYTHLKTTPDFAEQIKIEVNNYANDTAYPGTDVEIKGIGGRPAGVVPLDFIIKIIEDRVEEILNEVYKHYLNNYQKINSPVAGIVLTGGAAHMNCFSKLCYKIFNMSVRITYPDFSGFTSIVQDLNTPNYSTIVGTLYFALDDLTGNKKESNFNFSFGLKGIKQSIINFFKELT